MKNKVSTELLFLFLTILAYAVLTDSLETIQLIKEDVSFKNIIHVMRLPLMDLLIIGYVLRELFHRGELFVLEKVETE